MTEWVLTHKWLIVGGGTLLGVFLAAWLTAKLHEEGDNEFLEFTHIVWGGAMGFFITSYLIIWLFK